MEESIPWFSVPLAKKPRITQAAVMVHGQSPVDKYYLSGRWCIHLYRYEGTLTVLGKTMTIKPGRLSLLPPDTDLIFHYGASRCVHTFAHFQLPPESAESMGFPGTPQRGAKMPAMRDLGSDLTSVEETMGLISSYFLSQRLRAEVKLWDLLLQLADESPDQSQPLAKSHPAYRAAVQIIERELAEPLTVANLARRVGLSHNQLTRLFRTAAGMTVIAYLRRRRALRAHDLLRRSTLPLKVIAASVGLGDPHQFNKVIRRELRASPRAIREKGGVDEV